MFGTDLVEGGGKIFKRHSSPPWNCSQRRLRRLRRRLGTSRSQLSIKCPRMTPRCILCSQGRNAPFLCPIQRYHIKEQFNWYGSRKFKEVFIQLQIRQFFAPRFSTHNVCDTWVSYFFSAIYFLFSHFYLFISFYFIYSLILAAIFAR